MTVVLEALPGHNFLRKSCDIFAFSCEELIPDTKDSTISNIRIAAGIEPTSILVLKKKENSSTYECIEIIYDLDRKLLKKYAKK